jgi:hypothetical protein
MRSGAAQSGATMSRAGEHLAALAGVDLDGAAAQAGGVQIEGKTAGLAEKLELRAEPGERVDQAAHRTAAHGFDSIEMVRATAGGGAEGGEEAGGGTGVADVYRGLGVGNVS